MSVTTYNYIQLDYLETMTDGDADMLQTMLEMLITEIPEEVEKMQNSLAVNDWHELFQISHKMKTTFSFVGNEKVIEANKNLEHFTRHETNLEEVPELVAQIAELSEKIVEELKLVN